MLKVVKAGDRVTPRIGFPRFEQRLVALSAGWEDEDRNTVTRAV
jgi:hypothetical protein